MNSPAEVRQLIRANQSTGTTHGKATGYAIANLLVIPAAYSSDFLRFCVLNSSACPLMEVTDPGDPEPRRSAPGADLRTDVSRYSIYENGVRVAERTDIENLWRSDSVAFLLGSGISLDAIYERAGIPTGRFRWVVETSISTESVGPFGGSLVCTMRWLTPVQAIAAVEISSRYPEFHGAPIHIGEPADIGVDLMQPLMGPPTERVAPGLVAVFWPCGVTAASAAAAARMPVHMGHAPGHGFITDVRVDQHPRLRNWPGQPAQVEEGECK